MKKCIFSLLLLGSITASGQVSKGGFPITYYEPMLKSSVSIPSISMKNLDIDEIKETKIKSQGMPLPYSAFEEVAIDLKSDGSHRMMAGHGGEIWRYRINAPGARSIQVEFSEFVIPTGATLYIYNEDYSSIYGAFTRENMKEDHSFVVADFQSDHLILEYFEPFSKDLESHLVIGMLGQAFRSIFAGQEDENGLLGVNCYEGKDYQEQKHAVGRMTFRIDDTGYLCTGALINNTNNDGIPYFLTANHCISDSAAASTLVTYFNYENATCQDDSEISAKTLSGATLLVTGRNSDFTLLLLSEEPTSEYTPYYAGWDISGETGGSTISIHHAFGGAKNISVDFGPKVSYDQIIWWSSTNYSPANTHWEVQFDIGRTQSGSSGAPLFNTNSRIIGQLHGGDDVIDFYGKLSYSWTRSPQGERSMKSYLDPDNTDTTAIDAYIPDDNPPEARFFTAFENVCKDAPVLIENGSAFNPDTWEWDISPNTFSYAEETDSTSENPVVVFNEPGNYTVSLSVESGKGGDTLIIEDFLVAGAVINPEIITINATDSCLCDFDSLTVLAWGADSFIWSLPDTISSLFFIDDSLSNLIHIGETDPEVDEGKPGIPVTLTGYHGSCVDTVSFFYPLISQPNDDIEQALPLEFGTNGPFSNECASVQVGEPIPPHFSCTDQLSWCNETGVDIVLNSVWFYFTAPESGVISMESEGFDNEIAVYQADSFQDILNGKYTIVAANDDRSGVDFNPVIYSVEVIAGDVYWVQVDGSAGGSEGTFILELNDSSLISRIPEIPAADLNIYPQPAGNQVILEYPELPLQEHILVEVFDINGRLIYSRSESNFTDISMIIPTTGWTGGIYVVRLTGDDKIIHGRIVK